MILALTTEDTSVMRGACEAVYALKPLIASDHDLLREVFPDAVFTTHSPAAIAHALSDAHERWSELTLRAPAARARQLMHWEKQKSALAQALGGRASRSSDDRHDYRAASADITDT